VPIRPTTFTLRAIPVAVKTDFHKPRFDETPFTDRSGVWLYPEGGGPAVHGDPVEEMPFPPGLVPERLIDAQTGLRAEGDDWVNWSGLATELADLATLFVRSIRKLLPTKASVRS
jgi:hypothetical protein